jgi:Ca-activated chloride channel family protein
VTLHEPWFLLLAPLVPLALVFRRRAPTVLFAPGSLAADLPRSWRVRLRHLPRLLEVAGLLLVVMALARPVRSAPLPHTTEGIDIVLCIDTSSSMTSEDLDPGRTRLDVARDAAARFVAGRPDDRIGLVTFARYPDLRCPPTLDHSALGKILSGVTQVTGDGPEDATGIGTAVARAAQVLRSSTARSRVVILLTDGDENVATAERPGEIAPLHAGQLSKLLGIRVYAVVAGLGKRDASGEWVELDTRQVRGLAAATGGKFFQARDASAVAEVYTAIDELEKAPFEEPRYELEERFQPFVAAALLLLLLGRLLQSTPLGVLP